MSSSKVGDRDVNVFCGELTGIIMENLGHGDIDVMFINSTKSTLKSAENLVKEEKTMQPGDKVWVSSRSADDARAKQTTRIFIGRDPRNGQYLCATEVINTEDAYRTGKDQFEVTSWEYAVPIVFPNKKVSIELTHEQLETIKKAGLI